MTMQIQVEVRTLGDKIRVARTARRWSQNILSTVAKTTQGVVTRLERNLSVDPDEKKKV